jgi:hypothetical protein
MGRTHLSNAWRGFEQGFHGVWPMGSEEILLTVKGDSHADVLTVQLSSSLIFCVSWGVKKYRLMYKGLSDDEY